MRKKLTTLVTTFGGAAFILGAAPQLFAQADAPARPRPADVRIIDRSSAPLAFPAGFVPKQLDEIDDIKSELAGLTSDAVTMKNFDDFIGNLAKQDKTRVGDFKNLNFTALDSRIDQFRKAWKDKYGKDFDVDRKQVFDDRFSILTGEVSDPALALANWPAPVNGIVAVQASQTQQPVNRDSRTDQMVDDAKLEKGRNVALVRYPAGHNLPDITASVIHELPDQWRIDIPNNRTGQQLHEDLLKNISYMVDHTSEWPADVNEAGRMVSHSVIAAVYGFEMKRGGSSDQVKP